jgi:hypothetical protein
VRDDPRFFRLPISTPSQIPVTRRDFKSAYVPSCVLSDNHLLSATEVAVHSRLFHRSVVVIALSDEESILHNLTCCYIFDNMAIFDDIIYEIWLVGTDKTAFTIFHRSLAQSAIDRSEEQRSSMLR